MKLIILNICLMFLFSKSTSELEKTSLYDQPIKLNDLYGQEIDFNQFKRKKLLIVNVASFCGFTGQYEGLQSLYDQYGEKLDILGIPCNQFGKQEPGSHEEIASFCKQNYGVSFLISEKVDVKGEEQHALYTWLTDQTKNGVSSSTVKWNFQKYLLDEEGKLIDYYYSTTKPMSTKITQHLK